MILLYPPEFWFDAAMIAAALVLMTSAALSTAGWRSMREAAEAA
jgi:hypothetical protein